jgi:hypothetical protein
LLVSQRANVGARLHRVDGPAADSASRQMAPVLLFDTPAQVTMTEEI